MRPSNASFVLKLVLSSFLFLAPLSQLLAQQPASGEIDNARVVEMSKLGLGDDIIIAKIKTSQCKFSLTDNDLLLLKMSGVSDKVIAAMLEASVVTTARVSLDGKPLELHTLAQAKVGGRLGRALTVGIKSAKTKAYLQGPHANVFTGTNPTIVLELPPNDSVNNYILVRMDAKEDRREIEVAATGGVVGGKAGIRAESIVPTAVTPLGSNQFQLTASTRISRGEYIIYVVGSADTMKGIHGKGYDFTVD